MTFFLGRRIRNALARAIHEDLLWGSDSPTDDSVSPSRPPWQELSRATRKSLLRRADDVVAMLKETGVTLVPIRDGGKPLRMEAADIEALAEEEHKRWMRTRLSSGWRRGPVRDNASKIHPSMVPYEELSEAERGKDRERVIRVPLLLASAGLGVKGT